MSNPKSILKNATTADQEFEPQAKTHDKYEGPIPNPTRRNTLIVSFKKTPKRSIELPDLVDPALLEAYSKRKPVVNFRDDTPTEGEYFDVYMKFNRCNAWFSLVLLLTFIAEMAIFFLITPLRFGEFVNSMLMALNTTDRIPELNCTLSKALMEDFSAAERRYLFHNYSQPDGNSESRDKYDTPFPECPKHNFVIELFSLEFGGYFMGVTISGVCGDIYGRKTVAFAGFVVWCAMVLALCIAASMVVVKWIYFVTCAAGMMMTFMFYIILMEISPRRLRVLVLYLAHMYYVSALLSELVMRYAEVSWRSFQYCNVACLPVILFTLWYIPESPHWMWNKGKKRKAFVFLYDVVPTEENKRGMENHTNEPYHKLWPVLVSMALLVFMNKYKRLPLALFMVMMFVGSVIYSISAWKSHFVEFYSEDFRRIVSISVGLSALFAFPFLYLFERKLGQVIIYVLSALASLSILALPFEPMRIYYHVFQTVVSYSSMQLICFMMIDYFPTCIRATVLGMSIQITLAIQVITINTVYHWMQKVVREASYAVQFCTALIGFTILFMPDHQNVYLPNEKLDYA